VFVVNALCDVGAFAPRDYAAGPKRALEAHERHNRGGASGGDARSAADAMKGTKTRFGQIRVGGSYFGTRVEGLGPEGTRDWYKRVENNGWRPVTQRVSHRGGKRREEQEAEGGLSFLLLLMISFSSPSTTIRPLEPSPSFLEKNNNNNKTGEKQQQQQNRWRQMRRVLMRRPRLQGQCPRPRKRRRRQRRRAEWPSTTRA